MARRRCGEGGERTGGVLTIDPTLVTRKLVLVMADIEALRPIAARGEASYLGSAVDQASRPGARTNA